LDKTPKLTSRFFICRPLLFKEQHPDKNIKEFTDRIILGIQNQIDFIDDKISHYATNWQLKRMAVIDRNILRIGVFELLFASDIPPKVTINEAVELAKKYGDMESSKFVNGILDKIYRKLRRPNAQRLFYIGDAFRVNLDIDKIYELTKIDRWFLYNIKEIVDCERELLKNKRNLSAELLKKAKEYIKGRVILAWEDSRTAAFSYGTDEILEGRMRSLDEYLRKIEAVESEDVLRVAKFLTDNTKLNLAVVGPFKNTASFEKILKI